MPIRGSGGDDDNDADDNDSVLIVFVSSYRGADSILSLKKPPLERSHSICAVAVLPSSSVVVPFVATSVGMGEEEMRVTSMVRDMNRRVLLVLVLFGVWKARRCRMRAIVV